MWEYELPPKPVLPQKPSGEDVELIVEAMPDPVQVRLRRRVSDAKFRRRKRDKKISRWHKGAMRLINSFSVKPTEGLDIVNALAWNVYASSPRSKPNHKGRVHAMVVQDGNIYRVIEGLAYGRYTLDMPGFLQDLLIMKVQDRMIGELTPRS